jgi:hypothetical protein
MPTLLPSLGVNLKRRRVVHYYRRAFDLPSGVTAAIAWWAGLAREIGYRSLVIGEPGDNVRDFGDISFVKHVPSGIRQVSLPRGLHDLLAPGDVLYLHEGWVPANLIAAKAGHRRGVPVVLMPHGVYEPLLVEQLRYLPTRIVLEKRGLRHVRAFHLFYDSERQTLRQIGGVDRAFALPTGYEYPAVGWVGGGGFVAWFGRYDVRHKGLDLLLGALSRVPPQARPRLVLRGIDYRGGRQEVDALVHALNIGDAVNVGGPVYGDHKWEFLKRADAYVPCIVSEGTRMSPELSAAQAARVFHGEDDLVHALSHLPGSETGAAAASYIAARLDRRRLAERYAMHIEAL